MDAFYFGCHERSGHFAYRDGQALSYDYVPYPDGSSVKQAKCEGIPVGSLDSHYLPYRPTNDVHRRVEYLTCGAEGLARVAHLKFKAEDPIRTVISFCDRSIDSRPGAHSTFILMGRLTFAEAVETIRRDFAWVCDRFKFEITEWVKP